MLFLFGKSAEEECLSNANADFAQVQWRTWIVREQLVEYERRCTSLKQGERGQQHDLQSNVKIIYHSFL